MNIVNTAAVPGGYLKLKHQRRGKKFRRKFFEIMPKKIRETIEDS